MGPVARGELPDREPRRVVKPVDAVARKAVEEPVGDHRRRAGARLLGRLEDEMHGAGEVTRAREIARRAEQHRRVPVMATGVHLSRHRRRHAEIRSLPR